jgi:HEAT repeat protein
MNRHWLVALVAMMFFVAFGAAALGQEKTTEKKEKDDILGKSIGEWIKILREHKDPKFRRFALIALDYGNAATRTGLAAILETSEKDEDPQVRRDSVILLGKYGPEVKGSLKAIVARLQNDKSDVVREAAATVIGNDKFKGAAQDYVNVLADALKDSHKGTRIAAVTALRNTGDYAKSVIPALIDAARNRAEDPLVRAVAIHVVSRLGKDNSQSMPLLVELLNEENPLSVREAAIEGMGRTGTSAPEAITALGKTLAAKNIELRRAAAVSLNALGLKAISSWPAVKSRLAEKESEPDTSIRNHLIRLAGTLGKEQPEAIPVLTDLAVTDEATENRIAAIQELGELGARARGSVKVLGEIAEKDARASVREAAAKALKLISAK